MRVNSQTEKEYRDKQNNFGHTNNSKTLRRWLHDEYSPGSIRERRYGQVAKDFLKSKQTLNVLEIAAGVGDFIGYCSKHFAQHVYTAHELSEAQLGGNIREVFDYFGVTKLPNLSYGPVESLSLDDNTFDLVCIKAAVHHFESPKHGFEEIRRVLKPGGEVFFFEDPICLNIPIYHNLKKRQFALHERSLGINEHLYTLPEYLAFGEGFSKRNFYLDKELVIEYHRQQEKRHGIKKLLGLAIQHSNFLFSNFMIWRFSPVIFVFQK